MRRFVFRRSVMKKLLAVQEVAARYGDRRDSRTRQRIMKGIALGEVGKVMHVGSAWLFNESNLAALDKYMERRWNMKPLAPETCQCQEAV
jgi:hypothetical protein